MIDKQAIEAAISAHAEWKKRLENAAQTGQSEFDPKVVAVDDACPFGKWLYGLRGADASTADYATVKQAHAEFHRAAAGVLTTALAGRKAQALEQLAFSGDYSRTSGRLVLALRGWQGRCG
jgi:hypothetical protein